jgi:hypothetical protein
MAVVHEPPSPPGSRYTHRAETGPSELQRRGHTTGPRPIRCPLIADGRALSGDVLRLDKEDDVGLENKRGRERSRAGV